MGDWSMARCFWFGAGIGCTCVGVILAIQWASGAFR